jgi:pyruvate formate lyase activating enzyme
MCGLETGICWEQDGIDMKDIFVRPALLQEKINSKIRCNVCEWRCVIVPGGLGWCRTREHRDGRLVTLIYGAVSSTAANPVEKKPFYHFHPGTYAFTAGSWSCNFGCTWCQNYHISKSAPPPNSQFISPEQFIELTENHNCQGTSISFNEPTLSLEWSLEVFRLARLRGLYNTYVTNGYMTPEALALLVEAGLDAMNVDVKGDATAVRKYCKGIYVEKVWNACRLASSQGVHVEITTLVIPTVNDTDEILRSIAERIASELGSQTPWHLSAYFPAYRFNTSSTPVKTLERAWAIGKETGLEFVYVGNLPGHRYNNTYCPVCGTLLVRRMGFQMLSFTVQNDRCPKCGRVISGIWEKTRLSSGNG